MSIPNSGFKVLVIDDSNTIRRSAEIFLKQGGYQTCAIIKRNTRFSEVPIVMLSSKDGVFDKVRGRMVGSQDYLTKPFTKDQLLQTVQALGSTQQREM